LPGWHIRAQRRKMGLTLQALADQAGISAGFLSKVERNKATPSPGPLANLAADLDDTPHSFANVGDEQARLLWTGTSPRLLPRTASGNQGSGPFSGHGHQGSNHSRGE
jgi:transcriptional regulator with XRE-family HTH domain